MNLKESLLAEVAGEARTTRKHLERLSDEYLAWRPHAKSFTAGELTSHIVECFWWGEIIFRGGEYHYESGKH